MNILAIASTEADARAASAVEQHHARMAATLGAKVEAVVEAARRGDDEEVRNASRDLVAWCRSELVPHAVAEEATLYAAAHARPEGRLLVDGMVTEHAVIIGLVDSLADPSDRVATAAGARALRVVFDNHLEKENRLVLPLLVSAADVSVADLLGGMHELIGGETQHEHEHHAGETAERGRHSCDCGEVDPEELPVLDARAVPHAIRHATIFGALDGIRPGGGLVLVAPHDPKPLLAQVEQRRPGVFRVEYLEQGPQDWRLAFIHQGA
jgi:uncharacterized protein (DUF2249 family)